MKWKVENMEVVLIKSYTNKAWRSPDTYQRIEASLREKWQVHVLAETDAGILRDKLKKLQQEKGSQLFVFNIAEYVDEEAHTGFIPAMLEELGLPHLGSNAPAIRVGLDKAAAKELFLQHDVPTPDFFVVEQDLQEILEIDEPLEYPMIVKPLHEGGHIGIDEDSIVYDEQHLEQAVERVLGEYTQPAIVETYIDTNGMREFSVGVLEGDPNIYVPIEIDFDAIGGGEEILSYDLAQNDLEEIKLVADTPTRQKINRLAGDAFEAVGARDYSRVDIRMNRTGYYVLEINTMPGLGPHSFLPQAAQDILDQDYAHFIQKLTERSILSHSMKINN